MKLKTVLVIIFLIYPVISSASLFVGKPNYILYQIKENDQVRLSISVGSAKTACGSGWYVFQSNNLQQVNLLATAAQNALNLNKSIQLEGTGKCDAYGVEVINSIGVFWPR